MTPKKTFLTLLLIIILALAFRLPAILNSGSFWFDEIVSLEIAKHNIIDSWQYLTWENNPPLHYWFLHFWIKIFNDSEISLRLSSVLFSILSIIAIYFLGKKLFNKNTGLMASFLLAISALQLFLSMDARMYPMLLFFSILSCYYFWQSIYQSSKKNWLLYVVFTLLAFYTHLTGFFLFIIQNLYFIYHYNFIDKPSTKTQLINNIRSSTQQTLMGQKFYQKFWCLVKKQPRIKIWLTSQFVIFIAFLPWLINFIIKSVSTINSSAWYFNTPAYGFLLFQIPRSFIFFGYKMPIIELLGLILFGLLFVLSFAKFYSCSLTKKEFKIKFNFTPAVIFCFIVFLIPLGFGFLIQIWVAKYYLISVIGFFVLLAYGFSNLKIKKNFKRIFILLCFIFIIPFNLHVIKVNQHAWNKVGDYVESITDQTDNILVSAFTYQHIFKYYYKGKATVFGYEPKGLEKDSLLKTVKYNWQSVLTEKNKPNMEKFIKNKKKIIIVNPSLVESVHNSNLVIEWFIKNNWKMISKKQFSGFILPTILVFERPE